MISVILPCYNAVTTIGESIKCLLQQSVRQFEILVLDDGSTDTTEETLQQIKDERIKYIKLPHRGLTNTLNYGLSVATYDIVARMDADDLCVPTRFERQLSMLETLPNNTILSSWYGVFENTELLYFITPPTSSAEIKKGLLLYSFISHPGVMCYKQAILNNGGYCNNVEVDAFEDYQTWLNIKERVEFHIIPEVLIFQRYRKESLSNNLLYKQRVMYSIQEPYYKDMKSSFGIENLSTENLYRGWREYFFGSKAEARKYWITLGVVVLQHPRVLLAWFVTFLPEKLFVEFKEFRIKYRLYYLLKYFSCSTIKLRRTLKLLIFNETP